MRISGHRDPAWDAAEAEVLEHAVIPEFYTCDGRGIPLAWVARMRESMARLTPRFSTDRTVREYIEQHYLPAAASYLQRAADGGKIGAEIVDWLRTLDRNWPAVRFGEVKRDTDGTQHAYEAQVHLGDLDPQAVRVELYADGVMGGDPAPQEMQRVVPIAGTTGGLVYRAINRGASSGGLHGAGDAAPHRRRDSARRAADFVAAVIVE
jgi:starch phosphorylase